MEGRADGLHEAGPARTQSMTTRRFNHVIFADDFFRSAANGLPYYAANRRFLRGFFDSTLGRLGLPVREMAPLEGGGRNGVARLLAWLGLPAAPAPGRPPAGRAPSHAPWSGRCPSSTHRAPAH